MSKDRSKEILREIKSLRDDLGARLDRLESASRSAAGPGPSFQETEISDSAPAISGKPPVVPGPDPVTAEETPLHVTGPDGEARPVSVVVRPLVDVSLARAVETSLSDTAGIDQVRLAALSGDSAVIDATVAPGVSVVNALRRGLPVAFDVTEAEEHSVTIELARPETTDGEPSIQEQGTEA